MHNVILGCHSNFEHGFNVKELHCMDPKTESYELLDNMDDIKVPLSLTTTTLDFPIPDINLLSYTYQVIIDHQKLQYRPVDTQLNTNCTQYELFQWVADWFNAPITEQEFELGNFKGNPFNLRVGDPRHKFFGDIDNIILSIDIVNDVPKLTVMFAC